MKRPLKLLVGLVIFLGTIWATTWAVTNIPGHSPWAIPMVITAAVVLFGSLVFIVKTYIEDET